jgi:hypothetical protein
VRAGVHQHHLQRGRHITTAKYSLSNFHSFCYRPSMLHTSKNKAVHM